MQKREIRVAKNIGFCYGVRRAVDMATALSKDHERIYTYGALIHNKEVTDRLKAKGIYPVDSLHELKSGDVLVIRAHGVPEHIFDECKMRGIQVHDATCPFVKHIHGIVKEQCKARKIIVVGTKDHPETVGITGNCTGAYVVQDESDLHEIESGGKYCVVSQTTFMHEKFLSLAEKIKGKAADTLVFDTTCDTTEKRQAEAEKMSRECDTMVVIGSKQSSNTRKLAEICKKNCKNVLYIEKCSEYPLENNDLHGIIGNVAGASTPDWMIMEVLRMENHDTTEQSFGELLNAQAEVRLYQGKKVKGKVISANSEKIVVDLQYKADGILPAAEYSTENMYESLKAGDEIEVTVKATNDGTGQVLLTTRSQEKSKVNPIFLDEEKWKDKVFDAVVKEEVKGGVAAFVEGTRVFIPASQLSAGYGFVRDLKVFVGRTLQVKILEVTKNQSGTNVSIVASAKESLAAEEQEKRRAQLATLEKGKTMHGKVTRIAKFGAFVDIGLGEGIDGLLLTGAISWTPFEQISDVLSVGDEIDVIVLDVDMEKLRISLGRKQLLPRPWASAEERYIVGSIVEGKVGAILPSGALVDLEPTIRGFVHISNIAPRRVENIEDEIKVGDTIRVKVLSVDTQAKRIALSRKEAILDENPEIAAEIAREREERDRRRAEQREAMEKQKKERQQAAEERARRNEQRKEGGDRPERRSRREEEDYTIPEQERTTTSLASLLQGFKADEE